MDIKKVALALFCTISLVGCAESRQQADSSEKNGNFSNFSELVTKPSSESSHSNSSTTEKNYNVYSSVIDNSKYGAGNTWTVTNISEKDVVYFILPNDTAATSPDTVGQSLSYEYTDKLGNCSMIVTSHPTSDEASFFVADGIYSPPSVTEIWISYNLLPGSLTKSGFNLLFCNHFKCFTNVFLVLTVLLDFSKNFLSALVIG